MNFDEKTGIKCNDDEILGNVQIAKLKLKNQEEIQSILNRYMKYIKDKSEIYILAINESVSIRPIPLKMINIIDLKCTKNTQNEIKDIILQIINKRRNLKILYLDDSEINRNVINRIFEEIKESNDSIFIDTNKFEIL
jgi:hypothetical protein